MKGCKLVGKIVKVEDGCSYLVALQFGGALPWEEDKDEATLSCPDRQKVAIKVRRIRK